MIDRIFSRKTRLGIVTMIAAALSLAACGGGGGGDDGAGPQPPPPPPPPVSRTPQKAVFVAEDTTLGQRHLFVAGDEGGALTQLTPAFTNPNGNVGIFAVSPDGRTVAYIATADAANDLGLYLISVNGGTPTEVDTGFTAGTGFSQIVWSPDGSQFAYVANPLGRASNGINITEVFLADRDGSNPRKINGSVGAPASVVVGEVQWSPDGRYLAQTVRSISGYSMIGINTHDTAPGTANSTRINPTVNARSGERLFEDFVWSPASDRIVYRSSHDGAGRVNVYASAADGSATTRVSPAAGINAGTDTFSIAPDGQRVAFSADLTGSRYKTLYVSDIDGSNLRALATANSTGRRISFEWAPNAANLVFSTDLDRPGTIETYIVGADGSDLRRVNSTLPPNSFAGRASWSPDGQSILFAAIAAGQNRADLFVVDADGGNERTITSQIQPGSGYGLIVWSPDSSWVAYTTNDNGGPHELFASAADGLSIVKINAELGEDEEIDLTRFRWSDDSSRIVFMDEFEDFRTSELLDLWVGTIDGAAPIMLNDTFDFEGIYAY